MEKEKKLSKVFSGSLFLLLLVSFVLYTVAPLTSPYYPCLAPDESGPLFFAHNLLETGKFTWKSKLNEEFKTSLFHPRGAVLRKDMKNTYAPLNSPVFILLFAFFYWLKIPFLLSSLFGVIGVFYFYQLVSLLSGNKKIGLFFAFLLAIFPTYAFYSNTAYDIIPSLSLWIASLYYLLKFFKDEDLIAGSTSLVLGILSVAIRPPHIFLILPHLVILLASLKKLVKQPFRILILISPSAILFIFYLFLNWQTYGSPLLTGRMLLPYTISNSSPLQPLPLLKFDLKALKDSLYLYVFQFTPLLLLLGVLGTLNSIKCPRKEKLFLFSLFPTACIHAIFSGANSKLYGFGVLQIHSSVARYFLPLYLILLIASIKIISIIPHKLAALSLIALAIVLTHSLVFGAQSLPYLKYARGELRASRQTDIRTPTDCIVVTKFLDKVAVPEREVLVCDPETYNTSNNEHLLNVLKQLDKKDYQVFLDKNCIDITTPFGWHFQSTEKEGFYKLKIED